MMKVSSRYYISFFILVFFVTSHVVALPQGEQIGAPELVASFPLTRKQAGLVVRYGDLDGDGRADVLVAQNVSQKIINLTAFSIEGEVLWQKGKARQTSGYAGFDLAVQIYDINADGKNEILVVRNSNLQILRGSDGKVLKSRKVPFQAKDALLVTHSGRAHTERILIKDRMTRFWIYNRGLRKLYTRREKTGHFPMEFDLDGDDRDELMVGFSLFSPSGKRIWSLPKIGPHNDAVDIDDVDGDGRYEIALASSEKSFLLSQDGEILWVKDHQHSQHATIGRYDWDGESNEKQIAFLERPLGNLYLYDKDGNELWNRPGLGRITMIGTVDGWTGRDGESLLLLSRMPNQYPQLVNGKGESVATFEFPYAGEPETGLDKHYVQHFDLDGDGREEIFISSLKGIAVYRNADPLDDVTAASDAEALPNRRVYNASFYVGSQ